MTNPEKRELALLLYTKNQGLKLQDIAAKVRVHVNTITRWKKEDDWDGIASALLTTRHEQLRRLYMQLKRLNDHIEARDAGFNFPTKAEADTLTQITRSIENLERQMSVGTIIDVFVKFIDFVAKVDGKKAKEIVELQDLFVKAQLQ